MGFCKYTTYLSATYTLTSVNRKYLSDPTEDVRIATENLLADFLREIRHVTGVHHRQHEEPGKAKREAEVASVRSRGVDGDREKLPDITMLHSERATFIPENDDASILDNDSDTHLNEKDHESDGRDIGSQLESLHVWKVLNLLVDWEPGQGVRIDYAAIVEILIKQLDPTPERKHRLVTSNCRVIYNSSTDDEIQQTLALRWLSEFLAIVPDVMVPFTPRLIEGILPNLARDILMIQTAAQRTNKMLFNVIHDLPPPTEPSTRQSTDKNSLSSPPQAVPGSPTPTLPSLGHARSGKELPAPPKEPSISESPPDPPTSQSGTHGTLQRPRSSVPLDQNRSSNLTQGNGETTASQPSRPESPTSTFSIPHVQASPEASVLHEKDRDLFDYQATVNVLRERFPCEHEETRVAALTWLIMLHQKAPKKVRYSFHDQCHVVKYGCRSLLSTMGLSRLFSSYYLMSRMRFVTYYAVLLQRLTSSIH